MDKVKIVSLDKVKIVSLVLRGLGIVAGLISNWVDTKNQEMMTTIIADKVTDKVLEQLTEKLGK